MICGNCAMKKERGPLAGGLASGPRCGVTAILPAKRNRFRWGTRAARGGFGTAHEFRFATVFEAKLGGGFDCNFTQCRRCAN